LVAQDAGVVDQDVAATPRVERGLDDLPRTVELGDAVVTRHALGTEALQLLAHPGGGIGVGAAPVRRAADVVDHHLRALGAERQRDAAADAPARTGDDRDLALEQLSHANLRTREPFSRRGRPANMRSLRVSIERPIVTAPEASV